MNFYYLPTDCRSISSGGREGQGAGSHSAEANIMTPRKPRKLFKDVRVVTKFNFGSYITKEKRPSLLPIRIEYCLAGSGEERCIPVHDLYTEPTRVSLSGLHLSKP